MKKIKIKQIDAFTTTPFTGNPAGVVTSGSGLTVKQMRLIAREMNLSETAFVLPHRTPAADIGIRWFTPAAEVDLCGHATIASFHALAEEEKYGMTRYGNYAFNVETRSGILPVNVVKKSGQKTLISFGLPIPEYETVKSDPDELGVAFNTDPGNFKSKYSIEKNAIHLVVPIKNREELFKLKPNDLLVENLCRKFKARGVTVFTTDTVDKSSKVHTRHFAPLVGISEDPVTGSSLGHLGIYLANHGIVKENNGVIKFVAEQGDVLDKPGRVTVEFQKLKNGYKDLTIAGNAVTVLSGEISLEQEE